MLNVALEPALLPLSCVTLKRRLLTPHCLCTHLRYAWSPLRGVPSSAWNLNCAKFETQCGGWEEFHLPFCMVFYKLYQDTLFPLSC